ncbi:P-type ATPase [Methylomonas sp. MgM2]
MAVNYQLGNRSVQDFVVKLAEAIEGTGTEIEDSGLPQWAMDEPVTLHRFEGLVSRWQIASKSPGQVQLRHPVLSQDTNFGRRAEHVLRSISGVTEVTATGTKGNLWIRYRPELIDVKGLLSILDSRLVWSRQSSAALQPQPVDFRLTNITVGVATAGELLLPLAEILGAGLLVVGQSNIVRDAAVQLRQGKVGTPVWLTALLMCSIASGQVLAYALTDWSFRYWARRHRRDLVSESRILIDEVAPVPNHARIQTNEGIEVWTPVEKISAGQALNVQIGDVISVDGRVTAGVALVHEGAAGWMHGPVTKKVGDLVFAGSTVFHGKVEIEVLGSGQNTRNARMAQALLQTCTSLQVHPDLKQRSEVLVDRTVPPILATAGVGLATGGLFTAGAILHQDWLSGAELTVPIETLRTIRLAARKGAIVLEPTAIARLAESNFVVLDDRPALFKRELELYRLQSRLPESETDGLLRCVAGAGLYLGDERAFALAAACQQRRLLVRQPELLGLEENFVSVRQGAQTITLRSWPEVSGEPAPPLTVEIDGIETASLQFKYGMQTRAAATVRRLRKQGFQVFLASDRPNDEAKEAASLLGTDLFSGDLSVDEQVRFLQGLRRRGLKSLYVGDFGASPERAREAHVSISPSGFGLSQRESADIVLTSDAIDSLPEIAILAHAYPARIKETCRRAMIPNLLCVAGGFGGVLNGVTAGILGNVAVLKVYRQATESLKSIDETHDFRRIQF